MGFKLFYGGENILPYKKRKSDSESTNVWKDYISWNIRICYAGFGKRLCAYSKKSLWCGARRDGDIEKVWANPELANNELGWKAEVGIEDTLLSAWNWQLKLRERGIQ